MINTVSFLQSNFHVPVCIFGGFMENQTCSCQRITDQDSTTLPWITYIEKNMAVTDSIFLTER